MEKIKRTLKKENIKSILILFMCSFIVCIPLISPKINIAYDDGIQHIARLMGTYQSITEGQVFPVIMSNFCNGFGYSWNLFYSPLTAYLPLIFKIFGASFIQCIKIFMFLCVLASSIAMYFCTKEITKNKKIAVLAGIFYIFAPYRLTDMYLRNALAELVSFTFLPMVFQGLYGILKNKPKREYIFIIGCVGLILTHTVITLYVAIICFIYLLTQIKKIKESKKVIIKITIYIIVILVITSFFWMPLLEHKLSANYEVFKQGRMERTEVLIAFKLNFYDLFVTKSSNIMIYEIGVLSIIALALTPLVIKKINRKLKGTDCYYFYLFSLITGIVCCIMTLNIFPFEHLPATLKMLQFSFRLLEFSSFFFAFVVAVNIKILIKEFNYKDIFIITGILILTTLSFVSHLHFKEENIDESKLWPAVAVTENTGRVHAGCASFEYLPCKAFENRKYIEQRSDDVIVINGTANIENKQKNGTKLSCDISNVTEETEIELPYIYYLGYNVKLENNDQKKTLKTFENENGFVGVKVSDVEEGTLKVEYTGTPIMHISRFISIIGVGLVICKRIVIDRKILHKVT